MKDGMNTVSRDDVIWCYNKLLFRAPESEDVIKFHMQSKRTFRDLVEAFVNSEEFKKNTPHQQRNNRDAAGVPDGAQKVTSSADKTEKVVISIRDLPNNCFANEKIKNVHGEVRYPKHLEEKLTNIRISYLGHLAPESVKGIELDLGSIPKLNITVTYPDTKIAIGKGGVGSWTLILFRCSSISIGNDVSSNGTSIMVDDGSLEIGDDCMFADAFIHVGDNHAIFDIDSKEILNSKKSIIVIEPHVWVASRATILSDSKIGSGSIVAATATVKGNFEPNVILAGVPAKSIRKRISWTRSASGEGLKEVLSLLAELQGNGT